MFLAPKAKAAGRQGLARKKLSPGAQMRANVGDARRRLRDIHAALRKSSTPELQNALRNAEKKLAKAERKLADFDEQLVGGPAGLVTGGLGIRRPSKQRLVGDSQASNRSHSGFRKR
jgi:hypothetical protein